MPWHVALVVDPIRKEAGFFGWHGHEVTPLSGFYELGRNGDDGPVFPWRLVRGAVWSETYEEHLAQRSRVSTAVPAWPALGPWLALSAAAAVLWFRSCSSPWACCLYRQNQALQAAALPLLDERLALAENAASPAARTRRAALRAGSGDHAGRGDGEQVAIAGVANLPDARRYTIALRPVGGDSWFEMIARRATSPPAAGLGHDGVRRGRVQAAPATALSRQGTPLPGAATCTIRFALAR